MKIERIHLTLGLVWLLAGMALGEHMGRTGDHGQMPTHAHIMLLGGVLSLAWAILYKLFNLPKGILALVQTAAHHIGAIVMVVCLYLLYGGSGDPATLGPILGVSALLVMLSVLLMLILSFRAKT